MHTLYVQEKSKTILIPDHWDECSDRDLEIIFKMSLKVMDNKMRYGDFCVRTFCRLTGLRFGIRYQIRKRLGLGRATAEALFRYSTGLSGWAFYKEGKQYAFNYNSFKNRYQKISNRSVMLYGASDLLSDITFKEFRSALDHLADFAAFTKSNEGQLADRSFHYFLSCLYRTGVNGKRCKFVVDDLDIYAKEVRKIPNWKKQWIHVWFSYCVKFIQTEPFTIEGVEVELELLFPSSEASEIDTKKGFGWSGILIDFAKSGVFGTLEECDNTHLHQILLYWYKTHLEALRQKLHNNTLSKKR